MVLMNAATVPGTAADTFDCPRTLDAWTQAEDRKLHAAIDAGLDIHAASEGLQRDQVSVRRRISAIGTFEFESGTEEWVEIMSLALSSGLRRM